MLTINIGAYFNLEKVVTGLDAGVSEVTIIIHKADQMIH